MPRYLLHLNCQVHDHSSGSFVQTKNSGAVEIGFQCWHLSGAGADINKFTVEARADWHKQMSLWNAGMLKPDQELAKVPPDIAPLTCPLESDLSDLPEMTDEAAAERSTP